ncbi:hypothetical protein D3C73_1435110 [compost metagenome]
MPLVAENKNCSHPASESGTEVYTYDIPAAMMIIAVSVFRGSAILSDNLISFTTLAPCSRVTRILLTIIAMMAP